MSAEKNNKNDGLMTVRFPIGIKLIVLISFIVVLSLGSITALVSWLFRSDLRVSAEEGNFESNYRAAMEAEMTLENVMAHSRILIANMAQTSLIAPQEASAGLIDFFFKENPQIAAVMITPPQKTVNRFILTGNSLIRVKSPFKRRIPILPV